MGQRAEPARTPVKERVKRHGRDGNEERRRFERLETGEREIPGGQFVRELPGGVYFSGATAPTCLYTVPTLTPKRRVTSLTQTSES